MTDVDFSNLKSAEAWFEEQSPEIRAAMSSRAALRVIGPSHFFAPSDRINSWVLSLLKCTLVSAVSGIDNNSDVAWLHRARLNAAKNVETMTSDSSVFDNSDVDPIERGALSAALSAISSTEAALSSLQAARTVSESANSAGSTGSFGGNPEARSAAYAAVAWDSDNVSDHVSLLPLWGSFQVPSPVEERHLELLDFLGRDPNWAFWRRWYEQMWEGTFRDWDLAIEIAKIPNEVWEGDDALGKVAEKIREIEARRDLVEAIAEFKEARHTVSTRPLVPPRGHNNPPELIDDGDLSQSLVVVWAALDDLEREALSSAPDITVAKQALLTVRNWFFAACKYVGRKIDLAIHTAIKWVVPAVGGYLLMYPEKLGQILRSAEAWLK